MIPATSKCLILNPLPLLNEGSGEQSREYLTPYAPAGVLLVWFLGAGWLVLAGILGGCLLLHFLLDWTTALPLFHRLGYRTPEEIARERYARRGLRGAFQPEGPGPAPQDREDLSGFKSEAGSPAEIPEADLITPVVTGAN